MDNLTHSLVGALLGQMGLKKRTGLAIPTLILAANLPDIDVLVFLTDTLPVSFRRGWTHGVLAQATLPILLTGATGYIASHTWLALQTAGLRVVGIDNFSNSSPEVLNRLERLSGQRPDFERAGFSAFNCRALAKRKISAGKSSADIVLTMDAIEIALVNEDVEEVVILTTDSDFVPVVNRVQAGELRVVTCGKETDPTYDLFNQYADAVLPPPAKVTQPTIGWRKLLEL